MTTRQKAPVKDLVLDTQREAEKDGDPLTKKVLKLTPEEIVLQAATIGCSNDEINKLLGKGRNYAEKNFRAQMEEGRMNVVESLRKRQIAIALGTAPGTDPRSSVPMLIFLGKNYLGQADRSVVQQLGENDQIPLAQFEEDEVRTLAKYVARAKDIKQIGVLNEEEVDPITTDEGTPVVDDSIQ